MKILEELIRDPAAQPTIGTAHGEAKYIGTEVENPTTGRWNDDYNVKDGFYVIHQCDKHHVYQVPPSQFWKKKELNEGRYRTWSGLIKEAVKELIREKYMGFKKLKASLAGKPGIYNPGGLAAKIGRKKYGKEKFQSAATSSKKLKGK